MNVLRALSVLFFCLPGLCQDAVMFRGNPAHAGVYQAAGVSKFSKIKWKFHTDGAVLSSPAIVNGVVYVGSGDGNLYAVDSENGSLKWKFPTGSRVTASPAVSNGVVFFSSYDGNFYAVDTSTGKKKWNFKTGGERRFAGKHLHGSVPMAETMPDPFDFFLSSPAVVNGVVYFGSGDGNVYALEESSGMLKWKFQTGDVVHASPAIAEGTVFIGSWDTFFYGLDAVTGKEKWRFKTGEDPDMHNQVGIQSSAAVMDGTVYFGCRDSNFYALDASTGQKKWAFNNKGSWVIGSPAVQNGKVYFATSDTSTLYEVDAKSGAAIFSLKYNRWPLFSSPSIAGNLLYIGSHEGKLMTVDLSTQKTAWTFQTDGSVKNGPTYTKEDGTPKYEAAFTDDFYETMVIGVNKMMTVGAVLSSPAIVGDTVYVGSADGNLYALM